uniref:NmrA-like domain-containing protein n=1 Tax=Globisporangium ultimum (strain ATCC 200006 / CBS 805.95 / DAOM BR144) TaxID=431595 RepID=K3WZI7_GLOUD
MRVAIAGSGSLAKYLAEELPTAGHEVVILTRSHKPFFDGLKGVSQCITDYSLSQLVEQIDDCDAMICVILDYTMAYTDVALTLIEACTRSPKCKRFLPAEYGGNLEDYPDQPSFYYQNHEPVREALRNQQEIEWTLVSVGWFADYLVPPSNRHLPDVDGLSVNLAAKIITVPGTGKERFAISSIRDVAQAIGQLLKVSTPWRPYVYMQGEETSWLEITAFFKETTIPDLKVEFRSLTTLIDVIVKKNGEPEALAAEYDIFTVSGAGQFDQDKVKRDRAEYFPTVHFRGLRELAEAANRDHTAIV